MKKTIGFIFLFIFSGIIFSGIGIYAASIYYAKDITYTKDGVEKNVNDALDELYGKTEDMSDMSNVIYLGTGTSFNVSDIEGYESFTKDNFIVSAKVAAASYGFTASTNTNDAIHSTAVKPSVSYDSSNGNVSISPSSMTIDVSYWWDGWVPYARTSANVTYDVYLVIGSISNR